MTPTNKLRFVPRSTSTLDGPRVIFILQQWWTGNGQLWATPIVGEWRDVPVENK